MGWSEMGLENASCPHSLHFVIIWDFFSSLYDHLVQFSLSVFSNALFCVIVHNDIETYFFPSTSE